ncbi:MAG: aminoglycoside phosphotransferase family protein, partial [Methylococcaceae bacterium]|nr:aminoglycoside phosphotransferase family protein [Methylococcaceae bacterium]
MDTRTEQVVAARFLREGAVVFVQRLGNGLINDTYLVTTDSPALPRFVLQKINGAVFPFPDRIMANLEQLSRHLSARMQDHGSVNREFFRLPSLLSTTQGQNYYIGESGDYWRALTYIENSHTLDRLESREDAGEVGFALGRFHREVRDLDPESMQDSLPGFHITPLYL